MDDFAKYQGKYDAPNDRTIATRIEHKEMFMRWMIGATNAATSFWHSNAVGYGTFVHMWNGVKRWVLSMNDTTTGGSEANVERYCIRAGDETEEHGSKTTWDSASLLDHGCDWGKGCRLSTNPSSKLPKWSSDKLRLELSTLRLTVTGEPSSTTPLGTWWSGSKKRSQGKRSRSRTTSSPPGSK